MQKRLTFVVADSALEARALEVDRFAYENRFVPLDLTDAEGRPLLTIGQLQMRAAASTPDVTLAKKKRQAPKRKGTQPKAVVIESTGGSTSGSTTGSGAPSRPGADVDVSLSQSDIGVMFLERTRLRPSGFVLGEHLLTLSLAPGEEAVIEQRAFSEKQQTFEEVTDREQEQNTEYSTTLTTEMQQSLQNMNTETRNNGSEVGGQVGFNYVVNLSVSGKTSNSLTDADQSSRTDAARNVAVRTEKIASKFRAQHKITFKVSETNRFETSQKRVIRNPNAYSPIDLVYFKIHQALTVSHERFGARYCWAPFIKDPGVVVDADANRARLGFENSYRVERFPPEPAAPTKIVGVSPTLQWIYDLELSAWGFWGDMRADYQLNIPAPAGFAWDGVLSTVAGSLATRTTGWGRRGPPGVSVVAASPGAAGSVNIRIHAGADWGGAGAHLYIDVAANFVPTGAPTDADYDKKYADYQALHLVWEQEVQALKDAAAQKIDEAMAAWYVEYWRTFDPVSAALHLLVSTLIPAVDSRDDAGEVDFWNTVFDFGNASFRAYPNWWGDRPSRNAAHDAYAFENASWVRVFLPIRIGYEVEAMRWLVGHSMSGKGIAATTRKAIEGAAVALETYRRQSFGGPDEVLLTTTSNPCADLTRPCLCLGTWQESLPTDGTHLEVLLATTSGVDDETQKMLQNTYDGNASRLSLSDAQTALASAVESSVSTNPTPPEVDVVVNVGSTPGTDKP